MDPVFLDAQPRTVLGKKVKALRRAHLTPIHVYGMGGSLSLQVDSTELGRALARVGHTTPLTVRANGGEHFVLVREIQRHPVWDHVLHVDLLRVSKTERLTVEVPLVLEGEAPAARREGAMLVQDMRTLEVEALPMDLPAVLTVDVSGLVDVDTRIDARDVPLPPGVSLITDPEASVVRVVHFRVAEEKEEAVAVEPETAEVPTVQESRREPEESDK